MKKEDILNLVQNCAYVGSPDADHAAFHVELTKNTNWDVSSVFVHLGVDAVDEDFVMTAIELFERDDDLKWARTQLQNIATRHDSSESEMHPHLSRVFSFIELLPDRYGRTARIRFSQNSNIQLSIEPSDSWQTDLWDKIDYTTVLTDLFDNPGNHWRDRHSWCILKSSALGHPEPERGADPMMFMQAGECARGHISGRPFQLFSVGLLIHGSKFCVGIYDRAGARFSPSYHMWNNFETFMRVVRCITTNMTPEQLGEDPTVATLSGVQRHEWLAKLHANHLPVDEDVHDVPMYEVSLGGIMGINDSERWVTIGTPIWVSLSLFDRGTLVWRVRKKDTLDLKVLKNVWYGGARASAPEAHRLIEGKHPGVACCDGFNVLFPGTASPISTNLLRGNLDPSPSKNRTLYRLLYPPGRSLFEACSELELIRGMRAALRGHEFLCSQSILHRDIGVDNILLSCDDELREGAEGFLIDLELAIYTGPTIEYRTLAPIRLPTGRVLNDVQVKHLHWTTSVANRGAPVTGTLQFMAAELLASLDDSLRSTGRPVQYVPVEHQTHHDIESFIWVLLYSLIRRVIVTSRQNLSAEEETWMQSLKMEFKHYYGQRAPDGILAQRSNDRPWKVVVDYPPFFSDAIRELIGQLSDHLEYKRTNPLSHTAVLDVLDIAIRRLSQSE